MAEITMTQKMEFLLALSKGNTITEASRLSGLPRRSAYYLRAEDPDFAGAWENAIGEATDLLQAEVFSRALDRKDPKSHIMLIFELKKRIPEYKENFKKEVTIKHDRVKEVEFSDEEIGEAINILQAARKEVPAQEEDHG